MTKYEMPGTITKLSCFLLPSPDYKLTRPSNSAAKKAALPLLRKMITLYKTHYVGQVSIPAAGVV